MSTLALSVETHPGHVPRATGHGPRASGRDLAEPPFPLVTITGRTTPGCCGVTATGELDLATAAAFTAQVERVCVDAGEARDLELDLGGVTFLDSAALLEVKRVQAAATDRGWHVRVTPPKALGPRHLMLLAAGAGVSLR